GAERIPPEHLGCELHTDLEVPEEERKSERLPEDVAVLVENRDGAVLTLVDDRCVRAADQRRVHVLRAGDERVPDDLGRDRIGAHRSVLRHARVITRLPSPSSAATCPGGTTIVELSSSITAGPAWRAPGERRCRSSTGVSWRSPPNTTVRWPVSGSSAAA